MSFCSFIYRLNTDVLFLLLVHSIAPSNSMEGDRYFFSSRHRKYPKGNRPNRKAKDGYWKATGADKEIFNKGVKVGVRKTLVYYVGKPTKGKKTDWIMQEYRLDDGGSHERTGPDDMQVNCVHIFCVV